MPPMLKPFLVGSAATLLLTASACSSDDPEVPQVTGSEASASVAGETEPSSNAPSGPTHEDLDRFFDAVASADPVRLQKVLRMTADGSLAKAWLTMYRARSLASQQAGDQWPVDKVTTNGDEYKLCSKGHCDTFRVKARGTQLADLTINRKSLKGRIILGSKKTYRVGDLVTLRLIGSYRLVSTGDLVIAVEATAHTNVTLGWTSDAYVGPDGVQGSPSSTTGPGTLRADARGTYVYAIPQAKVGGDLYITAVEDGGAQRDATATIHTS